LAQKAVACMPTVERGFAMPHRRKQAQQGWNWQGPRGPPFRVGAQTAQSFESDRLSDEEAGQAAEKHWEWLKNEPRRRELLVKEELANERLVNNILTKELERERLERKRLEKQQQQLQKEWQTSGLDWFQKTIKALERDNFEKRALETAWESNKKQKIPLPTSCRGVKLEYDAPSRLDLHPKPTEGGHLPRPSSAPSQLQSPKHHLQGAYVSQHWPAPSQLQSPPRHLQGAYVSRPPPHQAGHSQGALLPLPSSCSHQQDSSPSVSAREWLLSIGLTEQHVAGVLAVTDAQNTEDLKLIDEHAINQVVHRAALKLGPERRLRISLEELRRL